MLNSNNNNNNNILTPCINVCKINETTGYCIGCFRDHDEISSWLRMTNEERISTMEILEKRKYLFNKPKFL